MDDMSPPPIPLSKMRSLIDELCRTDGELNAFLVDYFLPVKRQLDIGTVRDQKINVLFERETEGAISAALFHKFPKQLNERGFGATDASARGVEPSDISPVKIHAVLSSMLEAQLIQVVIYAEVHRANLPGAGTPLSTIASTLIELCSQRVGGLNKLVSAIRQVEPGII